MKEAEIKLELFRKVDQLDIAQLKEIKVVIQNYLNNKVDINEWEILSGEAIQKIEAGIKQADQGITKPLKAVTNRLKNKYSK